MWTYLGLHRPVPQLLGKLQSHLVVFSGSLKLSKEYVGVTLEQGG